MTRSSAEISLPFHCLEARSVVSSIRQRIPPTPSPGPPQLVKAPAAGHPPRPARGEGHITDFLTLPSSYSPLPSRERVPEERGQVRGPDANDGRRRIR
jgi:hypothetical protein